MSPLPPCPDTPNCYRTSVVFLLPSDVVLKVAQRVIRQHRGLLTGKSENVDLEESDIKAVFKIGPYRDDLAVSVETLEDGTTVLYIRSASRTGYTDYGVNRRRVRTILKAIESRFKVI